MKDNFSQYADKYARYRPVYPLALFEFITGLVKEKELAWDCGTGNGQAATQLSKYFNKVYASDISTNQLDYAVKRNNIMYVQEPAEATGLIENTVDLVTVSQALHWFDHSSFYAEVKRVTKQDAVIAAWTYSLLHIDPYTDLLIQDHHFNILKDHWDPERKHVDDGYVNIPFPFKPLPAPAFHMKMNWNLYELEGYLNTWSALQKFVAARKYNPVDELIKKISLKWGADETRTVNFPVYLKVGYVH